MLDDHHHAKEKTTVSDRTAGRPTEFVYLIGGPDSSLVKIGRSTNVTKRLANIRTMSPAPLQILWQHVGGDELEKALHRWFRAERKHGEWFALGDDPISAVAEAAAAILAGQPPLLETPAQAEQEPEIDWSRPPLDDPDYDNEEYHTDPETGCRQFTPRENVSRGNAPNATSGICGRIGGRCRC